MTTPTERAGRIRGNLNARAERLSGNNQARADRIRGNLTARQQRLSGDLIKGLQDLVVPERQPPRLTRAEPRGAYPPAFGYSETNQQPGRGGATGGGIASPLIEGLTADPEAPGDPVLARTYHPAAELISSDGLFVLELQAVSEISLRDANGESAVFQVADPYATPDEDPEP